MCQNVLIPLRALWEPLIRVWFHGPVFKTIVTNWQAQNIPECNRDLFMSAHGSRAMGGAFTQHPGRRPPHSRAEATLSACLPLGGECDLPARCLFQAYASKEVILSGGAINSPQLLMLSGVGNADDLKKLGIPVVCHLPGECPSPLLLEGVPAEQNGLLYCVSVDWGGAGVGAF